MGLRKSSQTRSTIRIPLRLDLLARELCKCKCHSSTKNPHKGNRCHCIPRYSVDGHALSVVQSIQKEAT